MAIPSRKPGRFGDISTVRLIIVAGLRAGLIERLKNYGGFVFDTLHSQHMEEDPSSIG